MLKLNTTDRTPQRLDSRLRFLALLTILSAVPLAFQGCSSKEKSSNNNLTADSGSANGDAGKPSSAASGSADNSSSGDCTAVDWANSGSVENPTVMAVAAEAGAKGHMFGRSMGLDAYNYKEEEFFFTGQSPSYTTRMVVHRPSDPSKYNGTVFVEWYNVSGQLDFAPEWAWGRNYFMREGYIHVAVSAQSVGAMALKSFDPDRYAAINLPNDGYSNAIFSQAGVAIRMQSELLFGKCMPVHTMLGAGQSQSSFRLASYLTSAQPSDQVYDGLILHSGLEAQNNDPPVPVFEIFTMTEGNRTLSDGPNLVKWVVAGATHSDETLATVGLEAGADLGAGTIMSAMCVNPQNDFPAFRAYDAAFDWMNRWLKKGEKPPMGMPLGSMNDDNDNVTGGVRMPDIDVPIATYSTSNQAVAGTNIISAMSCTLGGSATPFSADKLHQLYSSHDDYVAKYTAAADKALADGFMLQVDHDEAIEQAKQAEIPPN